MYGDPVLDSSANMFEMAIWDPTAKFNSCQYFQLYGISGLKLTSVLCSLGLHLPLLSILMLLAFSTRLMRALLR